MQVGDLVKYIWATSDGADPTLVNVIGIVTNVGTIDGYYSVEWADGSYDEDLVHGELELLCK